jgi:PAS domain S-box-containing protein
MVLLDLALGDSQGLDALRNARKLLPQLPIVVMSGLEDEALALQAVRESAQDYIVKDRWNRRQLVRALLHAFEREKLAAAKDRAERAKVEIEGRFRAVFEGTHDIICLKDLSRRITHVNPAMELLFGRNASEFLGTKEEDWYGQEVSAQIQRWDLRVLDEETLEEEHRRSVEGESFIFLDVRMEWSFCRARPAAEKTISLAGSMTVPIDRAVRISHSTVQHYPASLPNLSCSVTKRAHSPAPEAEKKGCWKSPRVDRCFSTK